MTTKHEIQVLLRFLSQDAKIPLPTAMSKVKELQSANLISSDSLAKSSITAIQAIFTDEKLAKQVLSSAKRVTKKRASEPGGASSEPPVKRKRTIATGDDITPAAIEKSLALPESNADEEELANTTLHTNRAPLVLAFAAKLLEYTMPSQPLSSRLSLAQAVVSVNAKTKALSLGIEKGTSAEEDGWGQGQPRVRVMGRDIRVMKRWGYEWKGKSEGEAGDLKAESQDAMDSQKTLKQEGENDDEPALWGLDLEALRSSNGPLVSGAQGARVANGSGLPIYTAQSARAYLLKSFASVPPPTDAASPPTKSAAVLKAEKERNLGLVLRALDLVFQSWAILTREELDKRAWAWYVTVRPEVENGVAGWGGKGEVKLSQILSLRRKG